MTHPTRDEWLSALHIDGPTFGVVPENYELKSPTFLCCGWKVAVEHLRKFESVVVGWNDLDTPMLVPPTHWTHCPPSDIKKGWQYRVSLRPGQLKGFLEQLRGAPPDLSTFEREFAIQIENALRASSEARRARMIHRSPLPHRLQVTADVFIRDPDVAAEVLVRAKGVCERCGQPAPFLRRTDGSPYLEVHHIVRLADGGHDTVENAVALCPNCHRREHYG